MENNNIQSTSSQATEQEIDLIEVIRKLWKNRRIILKITAAFMLLGILVAIFSAKEYTAGCTMVPQSGDKKMGGSLGGLAAMAGINLGDMGGGELLSPKMYPKILSSVPFQKELMQTPIKFEEYETPVRLLDYYTDEAYQKFSLIGVVKKYTIGLPGTIIGAIRGKDTTTIRAQNSAIQSLTPDEKRIMDNLNAIISLIVNDKDGYVQLAVNMPEPLAAAQLAERTQFLLQKYITEFKIEKVQSNLDFVEERFNEARQNFEAKQAERAAFRDANKNISSAVAQTQLEKLDAEYNLAFGLYSELGKQMEQAKIQVKETTPILTIVDPVTVPSERSKPKRGLICVLFTFLGGFFGCGLVLTLPFIANIFDNEKLKKIIVE